MSIYLNVVVFLRRESSVLVQELAPNRKGTGNHRADRNKEDMMGGENYVRRHGNKNAEGQSGHLIVFVGE